MTTVTENPGGDLTEPVTSQTERFVRCLWSLDHDLAYARHYPAVSWTGSFSRDADALADWYLRNGDPEWARRRARSLSKRGSGRRSGRGPRSMTGGSGSGSGAAVGTGSGSAGGAGSDGWRKARSGWGRRGGGTTWSWWRFQRSLL